MQKSASSSTLTGENQDKQLLTQLLEKFLTKKSEIFVQKTQMGGTQAYLASVSLEWFASRVNFASSLPLLQKQYSSPEGNMEMAGESIAEIQQRSLDWSRQAPLVQYLAGRKNHKFPPVLVVINQPWVDNPHAVEWDNEGRATKSTIEFTPLDEEGKVGLLNIGEEKCTIYALDGQHRLMGIQGLMELIKSGKLRRYKKDKTIDDKLITSAELVKLHQVDPLDLQNLSHEKIGVEFISAVDLGETRLQARQRVRSVFVHVNLMATPLTKGQLALLNEDNGFSIVARKIAITHPFLQRCSNRQPRVNWNSANISANSTVLTTLQALQDMSEKYLGYKFPHWKPVEKGLIPLRPKNDELTLGIQEFKQLFDHLSNLPSYQVLTQVETPTLRRFNFEYNGGEGNMLFRPVAQVALAQALGILVFKQDMALEDIFKKLRQFDQQGGFSGMNFPQSLWYGVLYDPNRQRIQMAGKDLAVKLLIYILGGIEDPLELSQLRLALAKARTIEDRTISFTGNLVHPKDVGLPPIL